MHSRHQVRPPRIFVAIASYRDAECPATIHDLLAQAAHPDRVRVGLVNQLIPNEDRHLAEARLPESVHAVCYHARESLGACWAKAAAHRLWEGEEFVLNIDSHMRFAEGWDELLLHTWAASSRPDKTIVSTYPAPYSPPDDRCWDTYIMVPHVFETGGALRFAALQKPLTSPTRSLYLSGNFFFSPASFLADCPYDPELYQSGEEVSMSVRAWTMGWDITCPSRVIAQHYYFRDRASRPHDDNLSWVRLHTASEARVRLLLESNPSFRRAFVLGRRYGLGMERSVEEFEYLAGIDFKARSIADWAKQGELRCGRSVGAVTSQAI
jgi:hypothetical protein